MDYVSNLGSPEISHVLDDVSGNDLSAASQKLWQAVRTHPQGAFCECPGIELLCSLYERGYRLTKAVSGG